MLVKSSILSTTRSVVRQFIHPDVVKNTLPIRDGADFLKISMFFRYIKEGKPFSPESPLIPSYNNSLGLLLKKHYVIVYVKIGDEAWEWKLVNSAKKFPIIKDITFDKKTGVLLGDYHERFLLPLSNQQTLFFLKEKIKLLSHSEKLYLLQVLSSITLNNREEVFYYKVKLFQLFLKFGIVMSYSEYRELLPHYNTLAKALTYDLGLHPDTILTISSDPATTIVSGDGGPVGLSG